MYNVQVSDFICVPMRSFYVSIFLETLSIRKNSDDRIQINQTKK